MVPPQIKPVKAQDDLGPLPLIQRIVGQIIYLLNPPLAFVEGYKADPSNITIGVNEKVTIEVGNFNISSGNFEPAMDWFFFADRVVSFEAEFPGGNPGGVWFVNFNPPSVSQKTSKMLVSNMTISLTSPPQADEPIQNTIIRVKIADTWVTKNLWWPEDKSYWIGGDNYTFFTSPISWFFGALFAGFGKLSGKILVDYYYVDVIVTVKPFHAVKIEALPLEKLSPNEITSIPVIVENIGNYNDTFNFRVRSETGYPLEITDNGTITLQPGELGQAFIGVAVPANVLDTGTLHSLILDIYSIDDPNTTIYSQRVFVETQGFYFSEENGIYSIGVVVVFFLVVFLLFYWWRKVSEKYRKKPEKPWKISEEQQHLNELKRTDKKAYEQERLMMEDEYKSALLWYKDHRKTVRKKPKVKKPLKKQKEKPRKQIPVFLKKPAEPVKEQKVETVMPATDQEKEKALAKIQREQEKQLRKMK